MATATSMSPPHGRIVVAGSLHLVGEVRLLIGVDATVP
jgi:folylpolyglutamate synthase/dihydropteroate synthase